MSTDEKWLVLADDFVIGTYDDEDDAQGVAAAWNSAYPHEPWFTVAPAAGVGGVRCDRCNRPLPHADAELRACPSGRCGYTWVTADEELHECLFRHVEGWHLCDCGVRTSPSSVSSEEAE